MSILENLSPVIAYSRLARQISHHPKKRLRVLLISHTCQSRSEGQPKADRLGQMQDIDLRVLTPDRWFHYGQWRKPDADDVERDFQLEVGKVRWPWFGPTKFYLHWYPQLRQILSEFRPDVIDLWEEPWGLVSAHTCWLRNRILPEAKIVSETEQNINKSLPFPFERFRSYTLANADFAVGRNPEAIEVLRAKGYHGEAVVVPNAVDPELFRPLGDDKLGQVKRTSGFVVGYVGRLVEEKGVFDLIHALRTCPPSITAVIVGAGPLAVELPGRIASLGLSSRIRIVPELPQQDLGKLMSSFDALAVPSHTTPEWKEQFGRVIIEAHACGVPVIGSSSGAIPKVIGDGGLIVPEGDVASLSGAICRLHALPELARELAAAGLRQVMEHYTWDSVAQQMAKIYRKVSCDQASPVYDREPAVCV